MSNDLVEAGYVFQSYGDVAFLKIDTNLNRDFAYFTSTTSTERLSIINKVREGISNMVKFDFEYYLEK
jgi:hypothetical protein